MNVMQQIANLEAHGYKVHIRHCRYVPKAFDAERQKLGECLTRKEFESHSDFRTHLGTLKKPKTYGDAITSKDGFTQVIIVAPNGEEFKGKHNFSGKNYNCRIGRTSAFGKALKELHGPKVTK